MVDRKRRRAAASSESVNEDLHAMARSLSSDTDAFVAADCDARAGLIERLKAIPPRQLFSPAALAAFKKQHVAMMNSTNSSPPPQSKTPPPGEQ